MKLRYLALALATAIVQQGLNAANVPNPNMIQKAAEVANSGVTAATLKAGSEALSNLAGTVATTPPIIPLTTAPEVVAQQAADAVAVLTPGYGTMTREMAYQALCTIQCTLFYAYQTGQWFLIEFIRESLTAVATSYGLNPIVTEIGIYVARGVVIILASIGVYYTFKVVKQAGKGTRFAICHPIQASQNLCTGTCAAVAATCKGVCFVACHPIQTASIVCSCVASPFRRKAVDTGKTAGDDTEPTVAPKGKGSGSRSSTPKKKRIR